MAQNIHSMTEPATPADFDMEAHRRTYRRFIGLFKWGSIGLAIVLIFLFWLYY